VALIDDAQLNDGVTPALQLRNVGMTFPGQVALADVNMDVGRGRVHALLGQNGSGKSTLIKILVGYHEPDPGSLVRIDGTLIDRERAASAHRLGLRCVHQTLGLIDEFNAVENFGLTQGYPTAAGRIDWRAAEEQVGALLGLIGVDMDMTTPLGKCAPVERTAVAVARAISDLRGGQQGCLLLDEPTAALAKNEVDRLFAIIDELRRRNVSIVYVSHRLDETFAIADDVTTLRGGRVVRSSEVSNLSRRQLIQDITGSIAPSAHGRRPRTKMASRSDHVLDVSGLAGHELQGISFDLSPGEILGVAGLQGSGRSELCYLLGGHLEPTSGTVVVKSRNVVQRRRGIAMVPSDRLRQAAVADFNTRENMTLADLRPFTTRSWLRRGRESTFVTAWSNRFEVRPTDPERNFATLSGGNQQKVVLAKWLGLAPPVLVIDEPTAGVDIGAREKIYRLLREQVDDGLALLICSSDLDELVEIADRVLVLCEGRISAEFSGTELSSAAITQAMTPLGGTE
jgi:ribose transport system ATP-binding protein